MPEWGPEKTPLDTVYRMNEVFSGESNEHLFFSADFERWFLTMSHDSNRYDSYAGDRQGLWAEENGGWPPARRPRGADVTPPPHPRAP